MHWNWFLELHILCLAAKNVIHYDKLLNLINLNGTSLACALDFGTTMVVLRWAQFCFDGPRVYKQASFGFFLVFRLALLPCLAFLLDLVFVPKKQGQGWSNLITIMWVQHNDSTAWTVKSWKLLTNSSKLLFGILLLLQLGDAGQLHNKEVLSAHRCVFI